MKKFFENFSVMGFVMFMLCVALGVGDVSGAICADAVALNPTGTTGHDSGASVASTVNNVQTTNNVSSTNPNTTGGMTSSEIREAAYANGDLVAADLIKDPIDQKLVQIRPYANPIDTLLRYAGAEQINNLEFGWYSIGYREVWSKVDDSSNSGAVMHSHTNTKNVYGTVKVEDPSKFDVTDTVSVDGVLGKDGKDLQLYIYKKDSTNGLYFTVSKEQMNESTGTYSIPAIADKTKLFILGRSAAEKDVTSPELSVLPEKKTGYCQIFMMQIEENTYAKMADKEIKFDLSEVEENVMFEYRRRMEGTWLRGHQGKVWDPEKNTYVYNTAGLLDQITKTHTLYAGALDGTAEIVDLSKAVFKGNNGSKKRFAICGSDAMARISKLQGVERRQDAVQTEVVFGITWSKMVTNFGQIDMVLHEQLDEYGLSDKMIIIDPQFLRMKRVQAFDRHEVDGKEHLITNGTLVVFSEAAGLAVYNPDVHCIVTVSEDAAAPSQS